MNFTFSSSVHGTFSRIDYILGHKSSLGKFKKIEIISSIFSNQDFPGGSEGKASIYIVGDPGLSPDLGRSPGEGNGNPLQYYCLENPIDRGAW